MRDYWEHIRAIQEAMEATKEERDRAYREKTWSLIGIPRSHWTMELDTVPDKLEHKEKVRKWLWLYTQSRSKGEVPAGLYLYGPPGTGKTAIAAYILRWMAERHASGYFLPASTLVDISHRNPPMYENDTEGAWSFAQRTDVLVLDDMGFGASDNKYGELLWTRTEELLRARLANGVATVITSNISVDALEKRMKRSRIASVIEETCFTLAVRGALWRTAKSNRRGEL